MYDMKFKKQYDAVAATKLGIHILLNILIPAKGGSRICTEKNTLVHNLIRFTYGWYG